MLRVVEQRRGAFAERNDVRGIARIGDVERHQSAEPPQVAPPRVVPLRVGTFGGESFEVEHHFDRPTVGRIEVHRLVGGVFDAGGKAAQAAHVGHGRGSRKAAAETIAQAGRSATLRAARVLFGSVEPNNSLTPKPLLSGLMAPRLRAAQEPIDDHQQQPAGAPHQRGTAWRRHCHARVCGARGERGTVGRGGTPLRRFRRGDRRAQRGPPASARARCRACATGQLYAHRVPGDGVRALRGTGGAIERAGTDQWPGQDHPVFHRRRGGGERDQDFARRHADARR